MNFMKTTLLTAMAAASFAQPVNAQGIISNLIDRDQPITFINVMIKNEQVTAWETYRDTSINGFHSLTNGFVTLRKALRQAANRTDTNVVVIELSTNHTSLDAPALRTNISDCLQLIKDEMNGLKLVILDTDVKDTAIQDYIFSEAQRIQCRCSYWIR